MKKRAIILSHIMLLSCVSKDTHFQALVDLEQTKRQVLERDVERLKGQHDGAVRGLHDITEENERLKAQLKLVQHEADLLKDKLQVEGHSTVARHELEAQLEDASHQRLSLEREIGSLISERDQLKSTLAPLERQSETMQRQLTDTTTRLTDATQRTAALQKQNHQLSAALSESQEKGRQLEAQRQKEVGVGQKANKDLASRLEKAGEDLRLAQLRMADITTDRDILKEKVEDLQRNVVDLQRNIGGEKDALNEFKLRCDRIDQERQNLIVSLKDRSSRVQSLDNELAEQQALKHKLMQDHEAMTNNANAIRQERDEVQSRMSQVQTDLNASREEVTHRQRSLDDMNRRLALLTEEKDLATHRMHDFESALKAEQTRVSELSRQHSTIVAERDRQIESIEADRHALSSRVQVLTNELDQANKKVAALTQTINRVLFGQ